MLIWRSRSRSISHVVVNPSFNDTSEMLRLRGRQMSMTFYDLDSLTQTVG